jgi:8-oxo-dGTP pyrophosphatase MutT (NUDIX family)
MRCLNCFHESHLFKDCKSPILSYGLIAYRKSITGENEYLLIQRKDTIAFIEIIRGKYPLNDRQVLYLYFAELTAGEIKKLINLTFRELWDSIFFNKNTKMYINEYNKCKYIFDSTDIPKLLSDYTSYSTPKYPYYLEQDYGFPKGRKNAGETILDCAKREFEEETGYGSLDYTVLDLIPFKETYRSINDKWFTNIYFVAKMNTTRDSSIDYTKYFQAGEIKKIHWGAFKETYSLLRSYHHLKRGILYTLHRYYTNYT